MTDQTTEQTTTIHDMPMTKEQYLVLGIIYVESAKDIGGLTCESIILREIDSDRDYDCATSGLYMKGLIQPVMRHGRVCWRLTKQR